MLFLDFFFKFPVYFTVKGDPKFRDHYHSFSLIVYILSFTSYKLIL